VKPDWFTAIFSMQMSRQYCIARDYSFHISACVRLSLTEHLHVDFFTTIKVLLFYLLQYYYYYYYYYYYAVY